MHITAVVMEECISSDKDFIMQSSTRTGTLESKSLKKLITWNVVIAFVVNVSASSLYDYMRSKLNKEGEVSLSDIEKIMSELEKPIDAYDLNKENHALKKAAECLALYGITDADKIVKRALEK